MEQEKPVLRRPSTAEAAPFVPKRHITPRALNNADYTPPQSGSPFNNISEEFQSPPAQREGFQYPAPQAQRTVFMPPEYGYGQRPMYDGHPSYPMALQPSFSPPITMSDSRPITNGTGSYNSSSPHDHDATGYNSTEQHSTITSSKTSSFRSTEMASEMNRSSSADDTLKQLNLGNNSIMNPATTVEVAPTQYSDTTESFRGRDEADELLSYVALHFQSGFLADFQVRLSSARRLFEPVIFPLHGLLGARSPTLWSLMQSGSKSGHQSRSLDLITLSPFINPPTFHAALAYMYGQPLLQAGTGPSSLSMMAGGDSKEAQMNVALSYAAAGRLLDIPQVFQRGIQLASQLADWVTLEATFTFLLDGALEQDRSMARADQSSNGVGNGPPSFDVGWRDCQTQLLHAVSQFLAYNTPRDLEPDMSAIAVQIPNRLPFTPDSQQLDSSARLRHISFGELSISPPSLETVVLSRILLTVPFNLLRHLFTELSSTLSLDAMRSIVEEREARRLRALHSKSVPNSMRVENPELWESVGWQESLQQDQHTGNFELVRAWDGFEDRT